MRADTARLGVYGFSYEYAGRKVLDDVSGIGDGRVQIRAGSRLPRWANRSRHRAPLARRPSMSTRLAIAVDARFERGRPGRPRSGTRRCRSRGCRRPDLAAKQPHSGRLVERTLDLEIVEHGHDRLEGQDASACDLAGQRLEPVGRLAGEKRTHRDGRFAPRKPDRAAQREDVNGAGDTTPGGGRAPLGVKCAEVDIGEHAAGAQPAAPDLLLAKARDEPVRQQFAARGPQHQMARFLAAMNPEGHGGGTYQICRTRSYDGL